MFATPLSFVLSVGVGRDANTGIVVLFTLCTDEGDEFQFYMHLSRSQGTNEGESECGMCELWLQGMCFQ